MYINLHHNIYFYSSTKCMCILTVKLKCLIFAWVWGKKHRDNVVAQLRRRMTLEEKWVAMGSLYLIHSLSIVFWKPKPFGLPSTTFFILVLRMWNIYRFLLWYYLLSNRCLNQLHYLAFYIFLSDLWLVFHNQIDWCSWWAYSLKNQTCLFINNLNSFWNLLHIHIDVLKSYYNLVVKLS